MKKALSVFAVLCLAAVLFAGCEEKKKAAEGQASAVSAESLLRRNFALTTVNGTAFPKKERIPNMTFNEGFRVSGVICNTFTGQGELKDNVLTVKEMATTRMACPDQDLNHLEETFSKMLLEGATVTLKDDTLTLRRGDSVLEFVSQNQNAAPKP